MGTAWVRGNRTSNFALRQTKSSVLLCVQVSSTCLFVTEADELFSQWSELFVGWFVVKLIFADTCSSGSSVPSDSAKYFGRLRLGTPLPKQQLRKIFSHRKNFSLIEI